MGSQPASATASRSYRARPRRGTPDRSQCALGPPTRGRRVGERAAPVEQHRTDAAHPIPIDIRSNRNWHSGALTTHPPRSRSRRRSGRAAPPNRSSRHDADPAWTRTRSRPTPGEPCEPCLGGGNPVEHLGGLAAERRVAVATLEHPPRIAAPGVASDASPSSSPASSGAIPARADISSTDSRVLTNDSHTEHSSRGSGGRSVCSSRTRAAGIGSRHRTHPSGPGSIVNPVTSTAHTSTSGYWPKPTKNSTSPVGRPPTVTPRRPGHAGVILARPLPAHAPGTATAPAARSSTPPPRAGSGSGRAGGRRRAARTRTARPRAAGRPIRRAGERRPRDTAP